MVLRLACEGVERSHQRLELRWLTRLSPRRGGAVGVFETNWQQRIMLVNSDMANAGSEEARVLSKAWCQEGSEDEVNGKR